MITNINKLAKIM